MSTRFKHESEELIAWRDRFEKKRADYAELAKLAEESIAYAGYWKRECHKLQERIRELSIQLARVIAVASNDQDVIECEQNRHETHSETMKRMVSEARQALAGAKGEA